MSIKLKAVNVKVIYGFYNYYGNIMDFIENTIDNCHIKFTLFLNSINGVGLIGERSE